MNYMLMGGALLVLILGYIMMSGGGSDDPNVFAGDYELSDDSFEKLQEGDYAIDAGVVSQLESFRNQEFESEDELMEAVKGKLGDAIFNDNFFQIRSAMTIHADMFSFRRITFAPLVVILGYVCLVFAIMYRPKGDGGVIEATARYQQ